METSLCSHCSVMVRISATYPLYPHLLGSSGGTLVSRGEISVGDLSTLLLYTVYVGSGLQMLTYANTLRYFVNPLTTFPDRSLWVSPKIAYHRVLTYADPRPQSCAESAPELGSLSSSTGPL